MLSIFLIFSILPLTVYGQLVIKARSPAHTTEAVSVQGKLHYLSVMFTDGGVLIAFGAAALAGVCWMLVIERFEVGYAYPFMALNFVFVPLGSMVLFGEPLPAVQLLGLALIVAGVTESALTR